MKYLLEKNLRQDKSCPGMANLIGDEVTILGFNDDYWAIEYCKRNHCENKTQIDFNAVDANYWNLYATLYKFTGEDEITAIANWIN